MKKYEVYHNAFGDKDIHVANVNIADDVPVMQALEVVFRKTNNIEGSWSKGLFGLIVSPSKLAVTFVLVPLPGELLIKDLVVRNRF